MRLRDCLRYPIAMPTHLYGVRNVLDKAVLRSSIKLQPVIESDSFEFLRHYARQDNTICFQIPIGIASGRRASDDVSCPIDDRDVPPGILYLGQLRGRSLPVAVSRFAAQISSALGAACSRRPSRADARGRPDIPAVAWLRQGFTAWRSRPEGGKLPDHETVRPGRPH